MHWLSPRTSLLILLLLPLVPSLPRSSLPFVRLALNPDEASLDLVPIALCWLGWLRSSREPKPTNPKPAIMFEIIPLFSRAWPRHVGRIRQVSYTVEVTAISLRANERSSLSRTGLILPVSVGTYVISSSKLADHYNEWKMPELITEKRGHCRGSVASLSSSSEILM